MVVATIVAMIIASILLVYGLTYAKNLDCDPKKKLQKEIDAAVRRIRVAQAAFEKNQKYIQSLDNEIKFITANINITSFMSKIALETGDEKKAKPLIQERHAEELERERLRKKLNRMLTNLWFYKESIEKEQKFVKSVRREAEELGIRLELTEAEQLLKQSNSIAEKLNGMRAKVRSTEKFVKLAESKLEDGN